MKENSNRMGRSLDAISVGLILLYAWAPIACSREASETPGAKPSTVRATTQYLSVAVFATATYNSAWGLYVYDYSITNSSQSSASVDCFGFEAVGPTTGIVSPPGWRSKRGYQGRPDAVIWYAIGTDDFNSDDLSYLNYPPNTAVYAGQYQSGFQMRSTRSPGASAYYAEGFEPMPVIDSDDEDPSGPFSPSPPRIWELAALGSIQVPNLFPVVLGADSSEAVPEQLHAPLNNPTRGPVEIAFSLGLDAVAQVDVLDVGGRRMRILVNSRQGPGMHRLSWNGMNEAGVAAPAGVYFIRLRVDGRICGSHSVVLLK